MPIPLTVQSSTLQPEAVTDLVKRKYGVGSDIQCVFWRKGMSDSYRITASDRRYFLKVSIAGRRTRHDVEEEVRLLRHLTDGGLRVSELVALRDGSFVLSIAAPGGERHTALYHELDGRPEICGGTSNGTRTGGCAHTRARRYA